MTLVYITKYALTRGVYAIDCRITNRDMAVAETGRYTDFNIYFHKGDWFHTREEALAKAQEMRDKKILSLNKQIIKLQSLNLEKLL